MKRVKIVFLTVLIMTACILSGCVGPFSYRHTENPDNSAVVTVEMAESSMTISQEPELVEEMEKPDKTLYNALFFVGLNGLSKVRVLDGNDYFKYELLDKADTDALDKLTEPTNINIELYRDEARTTLAFYESGFVYDIDADFLYIGTAGHCIAKADYMKCALVRFFDREPIKLDLTDNIKYGNFESSAGDAAMIRVPIDDIPYETLLKLKEVCWSKEAVNAVKGGDSIYSGNIYAKNNEKDYDKTIYVYDKSNQIIADGKNVFPFIGYDAYFITDKGLVGGQSGSALFDSKGNAVALCSGYAYFFVGGQRRDVGIFTKTSMMEELKQQFSEKE